MDMMDEKMEKKMPEMGMMRKMESMKQKQMPMQEAIKRRMRGGK